jgi:competence ComEA-like helix-hairpin-helix protein
MPYTRAQLGWLFVLAALFLVGLGVKQWRAGFPDAARWLDHFDREESSPVPRPAPQDPPPVAGGGAASTDGRLARPDARVGAARPADADPRPLDINRATTAELARLPGVGPGLAQRIVDERERRGPFDSPDALRRVVGIGPKKLAALRDLVTAGE